jgi:hypothetical protein
VEKFALLDETPPQKTEISTIGQGAPRFKQGGLVEGSLPPENGRPG